MSDINPYRNAESLKMAALENEVAWRSERREEHPLRELLLELTDACNLACLHCGSSCEADGHYIDSADVYALVDEVADAYEPKNMRISFTGGEPMLHPDFMKIAKYIASKGFQTGMTTNGTRITKKRAEKLAKMGFDVVTVSLDGMEKAHDAFRNRKGSWKKAVDGIDNLIEAGIIPSITTVANSLNIDQLDEMLSFMQKKGIRVWRVLNIDPIGRAMEHPELLLDAENSMKMWHFIEDRRINHADELPRLTASCAHYLGPLHELETRDWPFSCRSGVTVASITAKGEYVGCLDVERRDFLVMGHLGKDSFVEAWENGYEPYRRSRVPDCELCSVCEHARYCDGDSMHTWDFDANAPKLCIGAIDAARKLEREHPGEAGDCSQCCEDGENPYERAGEEVKTSSPKNIGDDGSVFSKIKNFSTGFCIKGNSCKNNSLSDFDEAEREALVESAIAKIEANRKLQEALALKNTDEFVQNSIFTEGNGKAPVEDEIEQIPAGAIRQDGRSRIQIASDYLDAHRDDEDSDELYETTLAFTHAGMKAGVVLTALAALMTWVLLRER